MVHIIWDKESLMITNFAFRRIKSILNKRNASGMLIEIVLFTSPMAEKLENLKKLSLTSSLPYSRRQPITLKYFFCFLVADWLPPKLRSRLTSRYSSNEIRITIHYGFVGKHFTTLHVMFCCLLAWPKTCH